MKKGRHRRFEEARALKRTTTDLDEVFGSGRDEPCAECGGKFGVNPASWCPGAPECESAVRYLENQAALEDDDDDYDDEFDEDDDDEDDDASEALTPSLAPSAGDVSAADESVGG